MSAEAPCHFFNFSEEPDRTLVERNILYNHPDYELADVVDIERGIPYRISISTDVRRGYVDGQQVLIREWRLSCLEHRTSFVETVRKELSSWRGSTQHPYIEPFIGVCTGIIPEWPALITPYFERGNILDYLKANPDVDPLPYLVKVAHALSHMHSLSPPAVHRSVRGSNIMIDDNCEPKLIDLSIGELPQHPGLWRDKSDYSRWRWISPEVVAADEESGPAGDVYSFAMTMLEILTGKRPFSECRWHPEVALRIMQGETPQRPTDCSQITDELWSLMSSCWKFEPSERPSMSEVYHHLITLYPQMRVDNTRQSKL